MSANPIENLIGQAEKQREHLHHTAEELKEKLDVARSRLRISSIAREHFPAASVVISIVGLIAGYRFARMFTRC